MVKVKQALYVLIASFVLFDYLVSSLVLQLFPIIWNNQINNQIAYAQSPVAVHEPKNASPWIHKWWQTGDLEIPADKAKFCGEGQKCPAHTGDAITYLVEANLLGKDTLNFIPNWITAGFIVTDTVPEGICNLNIQSWPFIDQAVFMAWCDGGAGDIEFKKELQDSEPKAITKSAWSYNYDDVDEVDSQIQTYANGSDKIYTKIDWNKVDIILLQPGKDVAQYIYDTTNSLVTVWSFVNPGSIPAGAMVWWNHSLSIWWYVLCTSISPLIKECDFSENWWGWAKIKDTNGTNYQWDIVDIEYGNWTTAWVTANGNVDFPANDVKCQLSSNQLSNCTNLGTTAGTNWKLDSDLSQTMSNQFYTVWWNTIDVDISDPLNNVVIPSSYNETFNGSIAGLSDWWPAGNGFVIYWGKNANTAALWLWIYPKPLGWWTSSYTVNGEVKAWFALWWFAWAGIELNFDSAEIYDNPTCAGTPKQTISNTNLSNTYTNIISLDEWDNIIGLKDYCINFIPKAWATPPATLDITVYQNRLNYYALLGGSIDEATIQPTLTNILPANSLFTTPALHTFHLWTGETTFEIEKKLAGAAAASGYDIGDEVDFEISITASGDTSTQPLFIMDSLSGSDVLIWKGATVSEVVQTNANCSLDDAQDPITDWKLIVKLKDGIETGDDKKCVLTLHAQFTGHGCFANDSGAVEGHYITQTTDPTIELIWTGVTVCSSGLQNLSLEKFLVKTGSDYANITASTTEPFYQGDPFIFIVKYSVTGWADFVLKDIVLNDILTGLNYVPSLTVTSTPDISVGWLSEPWNLWDLTWGTSGYIIINGIVTWWTSGTFVNVIKLETAVDPKNASAVGHFSGKKLADITIEKSLTPRWAQAQPGIGAPSWWPMTYKSGDVVSFYVNLIASGATFPPDANTLGFSWTVDVTDTFVWLSYSWYSVTPAWCATVAGWPGSPLTINASFSGAVCGIKTDFMITVVSGTAANTWCITSVNGVAKSPALCAGVAISVWSWSTWALCTLSGALSSGNANFTCTPNNGLATPFSFVVTDGTKSVSGTSSPFAGTLSWVNWANVTLTCNFTYGTNGTWSCTATLTDDNNPDPTGDSPSWSTPGWWWEPSPSGNSPSGNGDSKKGEPKQCKWGSCKPKEAQASNAGPGATVPYSAGIVNNDPETAMEWISFWDELPAGMSMREWEASIDGQVVKSGNKNGAKWRVDFTPDLVGVVLPPLKTLDINFTTKVDSGSNFWQFVNPAANLFECDDEGNKIPKTWWNSPAPSGNSNPSPTANKCGGGASNADAWPNGFAPVSSPLPGPGTGANSGTVSTWWPDLQCSPKLYDVNVVKKILSEKIEVGKSLKFEITVKNEWVRAITWLVLKDKFEGLTNIKITSSTPGIVPWYFSTATTWEFNIFSGITLAWAGTGWTGSSGSGNSGSSNSNQTITIIVDSILSGTTFVNMVEACGYRDELDPDSDACNGYEKGEDDSSIVSGGITTAALGDKIWFDADADGKQSTGEKWVADLVMQLVKCGTDVLVWGTGWVKTNSDGIYSFTNLVPDKYAVRFDISWMKWFALTTKNVGSDDSIDSDGDKIDGKYAISECITLTGGQSYLGHDMGLTIDFKSLTGVSFLSLTKTLVSTGVSVWQELMFMITVTNDGIMWQTWISIKDKFVWLTGLKIGTWVDNLKPLTWFSTDLTIWTGITLGWKPWGLGANPCGWTWSNSWVVCLPTFGPTWSNQFILYVSATLTSGVFSNYAQLCDYDVTKEWLRPPTPANKPCDGNGVNSPQVDDDIVTGWVAVGMIGDFVWNDSNKNGLQDVGEAWIGWIDLELYSCIGDGQPQKTKSSSNGSYKFTNLASWSYSVRVVLTGTNYSKYDFTTPLQWSDRSKDSNGQLPNVLPLLPGAPQGDIWKFAWTNCFNLGYGQNDTTVDFGLLLQATDLKVTKIAQTQYVNSGDIAVFTVAIENVGLGVVKQYTLTDVLSNGFTFNGLNASDKINYAYWMNGVTTGTANLIQSTCGAPANGWQLTGNSITWVMMGANIMPGQKCVFTVKAKVISNIGAQLNNSVTISNIPDETSVTNNNASVLIYTQPVCNLITLSGDAGDVPFDLMYSISWTNGTVRLLDSNQTLVTSSPALAGKFTIQNPGIYYIEYTTGLASTWAKCLRPVVVKELSECVSLNVTKITDTSYNVSCQWNYANQFKLQMYQSVWTGFAPYTGTGGLINGNQWIFNLPGNTLDSAYKFVCMINSGINYSLDKISAYTNPTTNQFQCPYKSKADGKMCAVNTFVAPLKVNSFDTAMLAQIPDPIEYCTSNEASTAICVNGAVSAMLIKNFDTCQKTVQFALPDLLITKSADKAWFSTWEVITYILDVKNIGSGVAKWVLVKDKIIWAFTVQSLFNNPTSASSNLSAYTSFDWNNSGAVLQPGQSIQFKYSLKLLDASVSQITNEATVALYTGNEVTLNNNKTSYVISKQGDSKIGDFVRLDDNKNGVQDANEKGLRDIQVQLVWCNDTTTKLLTKTDNSGFYQFIQVGSGSYRVMVQIPDKHRVSPKNIGTPDKDSNIDPMTNLSECFSLANGQIKFDIDAGLFVDPTLPPQNVNCGNNKLEPQYGEQCDGNNVGSDALCQNCQIIKNSITICGNSVIEPGEDCEVGNVPAGKTCYNCKLTTNAVCGDGKVSGYEECDVNSASKSWFQCIGCIHVPNAFAKCGNGKQELGEACDLGVNNGTNATIPSGAYAGKKCTASCNVINTIGDVVMNYEPPSCTELDPPSAMEGEYFPFWWDIDDTNVVTTCTQANQVLRDSMNCYFDLYAGKGGTTSPLKSITAPCYNVSNFDWNLLNVFNAPSASKYGKHSLILEPNVINNMYGEYKLRLKKIDYKVCVGTGGQTSDGSVTPFNTFNDSYDETICEYNFTVTRPYLMQVGGLISSNATDSLYNFYGFASNEGTQNILDKYGVKLQSVGLDQYAGSSNFNYLIDTFVDKYNKLSVANVAYGPNALKVPGKEIYVFRGSYTYEESKFDINKPRTIVVMDGDLKIVWNVKWNTLFVVPAGDIIIGSNNCNETQIINGIYITKNSILSDTLYVNNNLANNRCSKGNLEVRWLLVGKGLQDLVSKRRSVLDGWFVKNNKKDAIINGASVLIKSNDALFTNPAPGLEEFTKELSTYKK